jgi:hypothetical protein
MTSVQIWILAPFIAGTAVLVVAGLIWLAQELCATNPPRSLGEFKARANRAKLWYLNPFADRTVRFWKYASWIAGGLWLLAGLLHSSTK